MYINYKKKFIIAYKTGFRLRNYFYFNFKLHNDPL